MQDIHYDASAQYLAAIVESSDDAIVSKRLDGIITSWNAAAERIFGYTAEEAIGRSIRLIIPADRQSEEDEVLAQVRRGLRVEPFETIRQRKDGTLVPISLTVSPIRTPDGTVIGASKIARDISERKAAEAAMARLNVAHGDLQRRLLQLVAASSTLLESERVDDVMSAALRLSADLIKGDAFALWRLHRAEQVWVVDAHQGLSPEFIAHSVAAARQGGPVMAPLGAPLAVPDLENGPAGLDHRLQQYRAEGLRSMLVIPLHMTGETTGTLVIYYREPHEFSSVELHTAQALGNLVATAITTTELYEARRHNEQQALFLARVTQALSNTLDYEKTLHTLAELAVPQIADWCAVDVLREDGGAERIALTHINPEKVELARAYADRYPPDPSSPYSTASVVRSGTPVLMPAMTDEMLVAGARDAEHLRALRELGIRSFMCVPLRGTRAVLGVITFVSAESGRHYTDEDLRFAEHVVARATLAIENARAYEEVGRANRLKDEFLATLSHELRTPLNSILGYTRMLRSGILHGEKHARAIETVDRNASALAQIVEDVLDVSRIVSGKLRLNVAPVDLAPVIGNAIATVVPAAQAKGVEVPAPPSDPIPIMGDVDRLQQVFWNLMTNAVKFTSRGGRVDVHVVRTLDEVEVSISDTGQGIPPAVLPYVFDRFRQGDSRSSREHGGLGLGLAIARHIVEMHGGTIHATSEGEGRGATFTVRIPLQPDAAA